MIVSLNAHYNQLFGFPDIDQMTAISTIYRQFIASEILKLLRKISILVESMKNKEDSQSFRLIALLEKLRIFKETISL